MTKIIDGKKLAQETRTKLKTKADNLKEKGISPKLSVILVGDDSASKVYVRNKSKACKDVGIDYEEHILKSDTTMDELLGLIKELNNREDIHGILLQSPIPNHLDINKAFKTISPEKDVDGFNPVNVGKLSINEDTFISCTPLGIIKMLEDNNIDIEGKHAVVIGRSNIVGKPLSQCLLNKNATVTIAHSRTQNLEGLAKQADILVACVGKANFVTKEMVKEDAVVIDVGINRDGEGKLVGDVDFDNVYTKTSYITPVPGGVGPMTIAMLMNNVVKSAQNKLDNIK